MHSIWYWWHSKNDPDYVKGCNVGIFENNFKRSLFLFSSKPPILSTSNVAHNYNLEWHENDIFNTIKYVSMWNIFFIIKNHLYFVCKFGRNMPYLLFTRSITIQIKTYMLFLFLSEGACGFLNSRSGIGTSEGARALRSDNINISADVTRNRDMTTSISIFLLLLS